MGAAPRQGAVTADLVGRVGCDDRDVDRIPADARLDALRECLPILDLERRRRSVPLVPADGSDAMSGVPSLRPIPSGSARAGSAGAGGRSRPRCRPGRPARMSREARPVFITTERVNPTSRSGVHLGDVARAALALEREPVAVRARAFYQALWIERPPPRIVLTKYDGLTYASAMTADAPAWMKPAA